MSAIILVNKEASVSFPGGAGVVWWCVGRGSNLHAYMHILLIFTWTEVLETHWKVALMAVLTFRL